MQSSEITADLICEAFPKMGLTPVQGAFLEHKYDGTLCGCADGALYLISGGTSKAYHEDLRATFTVFAETTGLTAKQMQAISDGWEDFRDGYYVSDPELERLWTAGREAAMRLGVD